MKITVTRFTVTKRHALTISRGTSAGSENLLVEVEQEGVVGIGEMAPAASGKLEENADTGQEDIEKKELFLSDLTPWDFQILESLPESAQGGYASRAAIDMAMHDWIGKKLGIPVWKLFGLNPANIVPTSVTVGINPPEVIREILPEILARTEARILKVKLGNLYGIEADKVMFAAAQETVPQGVVWRVDANGGWSVKDTQEMAPWLQARGVQFIEQPLPRGQEVDLPEVHRDSALPIFVDESVYTASDIPAIAPYIDGVNLKLMKCGGLREALRIIHTARAHGLKVMIGCMSETSLAITAAAHLAPLADALDLDSHLNLNPDPFVGARYEEGRVLPSGAPGLGVRLKEASE